MAGDSDFVFGWTTSPIGQLALVVTGNTPSKKDPRNYGGDLPFVKPTELQDNRVSSGSETLSERGVASARVLPPGSVMVTCIGNLGRTGWATTSIAVNQQINAVYPSEGCADRWLFYALQTRRFRKSLEAQASATTISIVNKGKFERLSVPVAPLAEQYRIVEAIEAHFSRLDAAVAALKRVQANLKRYRASVLKAACEGRLVPTEAELARKEGRDYEPASKLLERILEERRKRWEEQEWAKYVEKAKRKLAEQCRKNNGEDPPPHVLEQDAKYSAYLPKGDKWKAKYTIAAAPMESYVFEVPEGWSRASLGALADLKGGITVDKKRAKLPNATSVPYLRVANVQRGKLDLGEIKEIPATPDQVDALRLMPGDILLNEGGDRDKLGRGWIWEAQLPLCIHQNHVFRARLYAHEVSPRFVAYYTNSAAQQYFIDEGKQTTNLASISLSKLASLPIPLPPSAEQQRIVAEVERRLSVVDELEAAVAANLKRAERLRQAILKRAFEGRLVPTEHELAQAEGRSYETAEQLLARIKATREAKPGEKGQKKDPVKQPTRKKPAANKLKRKAENTLF